MLLDLLFCLVNGLSPLLPIAKFGQFLLWVITTSVAITRSVHITKWPQKRKKKKKEEKKTLPVRCHLILFKLFIYLFMARSFGVG